MKFTVTVISDGKETVTLRNVKLIEKGNPISEPKDTSTKISEDNMRWMLSSILENLNLVKNKLVPHRKYAKAVSHISQAIEELANEQKYSNQKSETKKRSNYETNI